MRVEDFAKFITARDTARQNKEAGEPQPWTNDPIISQYRFCNVRREDDAVTRWIAKNWRDPHGVAVDYWFATVVARLFNNPETLAAIEKSVFHGHSVAWRSESARAKLHRRRDAGERIFNPAYIVSTNGIKMDKIDYVIDIVLDPLWEARTTYRPQPNETLESYHRRLEQARGLGSFMAAQVIADLKYTPALKRAKDWRTFAASGPGSRRGLNRVFGMPLDIKLSELQWRKDLTKLRDAVLPLLPKPLQDLHAQDIQNCLCEFDKYERARTGEGKPKQLYAPAGETK